VETAAQKALIERVTEFVCFHHGRWRCPFQSRINRHAVHYETDRGGFASTDDEECLKRLLHLKGNQKIHSTHVTGLSSECRGSVDDLLYPRSSANAVAVTWALFREYINQSPFSKQRLRVKKESKSEYGASKVTRRRCVVCR